MGERLGERRGEEMMDNDKEGGRGDLTKVKWMSEGRLLERKSQPF